MSETIRLPHRPRLVVVLRRRARLVVRMKKGT